MESWIPESVGYGRYHVLGEIGAGRSTLVLEATDTLLHVPRALKVLRASMTNSAELRQRQISEARLMSTLRHPNIVGFYDAFIDPEVGATLVFERVDGVSLGALQADGRLAPTLAVTALTDALLGLEAAHEQGILHRDIKPSNILLDGGGRAKLIDFGVSFRLGERPPAPAGTPVFMPPEQRLGSVSRLSDVYAAGATLYALLTGATPPDLSRCSHDPTHPVWAGLPHELASIIQQACAMNPAQRYASAGMLRAALFDGHRRHEQRSPSIPPYRAIS